MVATLQRWFIVPRYPYNNRLDSARASALLGIVWASVPIWLVVLLATIVSGAGGIDEVALAIPVSFVLSLGFGLFIYQSAHTGRLQQAAWGFVVLSLIFAALAAFDVVTVEIADGVGGTAALEFVLPLLAAGLLLERRDLLLTSAGVLAIILTGGVLQSQAESTLRYAPVDTFLGDVLLALGVSAVSFLLLYIISAALAILAHEAQSQNRDLETLSQHLSRGLSVESGDEDALLTKTLTFLQQDMGYNFAQVFLVEDEGRTLRRTRASLSEHQSNLEERSPAEENSALAEVVRFGQPAQISLDSPPEERAYFLPTTRSALLVPLVHANQALGVLEIQSSADSITLATALPALNLLANQTAAALVNVRIFSELRRSLRQQQRTGLGLQRRLRELERSGQQGVVASWTSYLEARETAAMGFDLHEQYGTPESADDMPETLRAAVEEAELSVHEEGDERLVKVPISVRGQSLGAMVFGLPKEQALPDYQLEMVRTVATRLALALENGRLFEQSRVQASREQKVNEASSLLFSATDVNAVLNLAASSFNETLGALYTRIYVEPEALEQLQSAQVGSDKKS